jgi:hypothetical protein
MFDPITIGIFISLLAGAAIYVAILTATMVRDYIRSARTKDHINQSAAAISQKLANGNYRVAVGFMEGKTKIVDAKVWETKKLDVQLSQLLPKTDEAILIPV